MARFSKKRVNKKINTLLPVLPGRREKWAKGACAVGEGGSCSLQLPSFREIKRGLIETSVFVVSASISRARSETIGDVCLN